MAAGIAVCRKCKNAACLVEILEARSEFVVQPVRCQKICHGPVVGLVIDDTMEWFERVDDVKSVAALIKFAKKPRRDPKVPKPLRKHRVKRHSGRPPR